MRSSSDIVVIGAGVLGLSVASALAARGRSVRVVDPGEPNASSVAAGMIAPAAEVLLDDLSDATAALFRQAAALWPKLAERTGVDLDHAPAEWIGDDPDAVVEALTAKCFASERHGDRVRLPSDIRLDPAQALAALTRSAGAPPLPHRLATMERAPDGWRLIFDGGEILASRIVFANGTAGPLPGTPDAVVRVLDHVSPIGGQIGRVPSRLTDRVLRGQGAYVAPGAGASTLIGATMVEGERRPTPDPQASTALIDIARRLTGRAVSDPVEWRVGVRGASPDGLPMAGATRDPSIHVALAPRRNGWLLGPLVGAVVADAIEGQAHPLAPALHPLRFSPPAD